MAYSANVAPARPAAARALPIGRGPISTTTIGRPTGALPSPERYVKLAPWDYLFLPFNSFLFHDIFYPIAVGGLVLVIAGVILYNLRTRQLHAHPPYLDLYEWILWTTFIGGSMLIIAAVFFFDFLFVVFSLPIMLGVLLSARFFPFPPPFPPVAQELPPPR